MKYDVVIWDFDGTLADTCEDVWNSIEYAASVCNGKTSKIESLFREDSSHLSRSMVEIFNAIEPLPDKEMYELFVEQVRIHYREINEYPNTILYPGMVELLQYLIENGVKNYIISLKPIAALERIISRKGWSGYFKEWLSPDALGEFEKTKSELIAYLIKSNHFQTEKVIYIGDTFSDVIAAKNNNVDCIGVTYGDGEVGKLLEATPMAIADDIETIRKLLSEV